MLKVLRFENFDPKNHPQKYRRGFIIPYPGENRKILFIADTEGIDHEKLGDDFVYLSDEGIKDVIMAEGVKDEEEFNKLFNMMKDIREGYKSKKDKYPSSRKDYLVYEKGAVTFDMKSFCGRFIQFRDNGRGFSIHPETERIAFGYMMDGWKNEPIPEDSLQSGPTFF